MNAISKFKMALAGAVASVVIAGPASANDAVSFALNWVPGPQHEEFVVAQANGIFKKHGLDVTMHAPAASTDPIKLVASGNDQFGIAYAGDIIQARAQGVPVVAVAVIHRHIPLGLITAPGSGITQPKDLEGKTIGLTPVPNNRAMFWDFVKQTGLDKDKLKVVTVQFNGPQVVAAGRADAADAVSFYEVGVYKQLTGKDPNFISFTKYGVPDGYFFTIITSEKNLKEHPESVKEFVASVLEAEKWSVEHPEEARKILLSNVKEVSEPFAVQSRAAVVDILTDKDTKEHGLGWQSPEVWKTMADWYLQQKLIDKPVDTSTAFTNDFLPPEPVMLDK